MGKFLDYEGLKQFKSHLVTRIVDSDFNEGNTRLYYVNSKNIQTINNSRSQLNIPISAGYGIMLRANNDDTEYSEWTFIDENGNCINEPNYIAWEGALPTPTFTINSNVVTVYTNTVVNQYEYITGPIKPYNNSINNPKSFVDTYNRFYAEMSGGRGIYGRYAMTTSPSCPKDPDVKDWVNGVTMDSIPMRLGAKFNSDKTSVYTGDNGHILVPETIDVNKSNPNRVKQFATSKNYVDTQIANHTHSNYSNINHTHDGRYSLAGHTHDGRYSLVSHAHDDLYAPIGHTHDNVDLTNITTEHITLQPADGSYNDTVSESYPYISACYVNDIYPTLELNGAQIRQLKNGAIGIGGTDYTCMQLTKKGSVGVALYKENDDGTQTVDAVYEVAEKFKEIDDTLSTHNDLYAPSAHVHDNLYAPVSHKHSMKDITGYTPSSNTSSGDSYSTYTDFYPHRGRSFLDFSQAEINGSKLNCKSQFFGCSGSTDFLTISVPDDTSITVEDYGLHCVDNSGKQLIISGEIDELTSRCKYTVVYIKMRINEYNNSSAPIRFRLYNDASAVKCQQVEYDLWLADNNYLHIKSKKDSRSNYYSGIEAGQWFELAILTYRHNAGASAPYTSNVSKDLIYTYINGRLMLVHKGEILKDDTGTGTCYVHQYRFVTGVSYNGSFDIACMTATQSNLHGTDGISHIVPQLAEDLWSQQVVSWLEQLDSNNNVVIPPEHWDS